MDIFLSIRSVILFTYSFFLVNSAWSNSLSNICRRNPAPIHQTIKARLKENPRGRMKFVLVGISVLVIGNSTFIDFNEKFLGT